MLKLFAEPCTHVCNGGFYYLNPQGATGHLHSKVSEWLGIDERNPVLIDNDSATFLNDHAEKSFEAIADLIEAKYL